MKLVKTASGKRTIKMSKSEWQSIGKTAGWTRTSYSNPDNIILEKCPECGQGVEPNKLKVCDDADHNKPICDLCRREKGNEGVTVT